MKKTLLASALLVVSGNAMASQVRVDALQNSRQVNQDFVEMFAQPSTMWSGQIKDQALMENSTGGFLMSSGDDSKYGIYLGRQPSLALFNVALADAGSAVAAPYNTVNTPLNVFYGRNMGGMNWGFNFLYANSKSAGGALDYTQNFMGLAAGVDGGSWRADLSLSLGGKIENQTASTDVTGAQNMRLQAEYDLSEDLRVYADVTQGGAKATMPAVGESAVMNMQVGIERKMVKDGATFFYGAALNNNSTERKTTAVKNEVQSLPVYFGLEADATSWLVLRGSVRQAVLVGSDKTGAATDTLVGGPTYAAGAGIRLGNFMVDGTVTAGATGGTLTSAPFMSSVALSYNF